MGDAVVLDALGRSASARRFNGIEGFVLRTYARSERLAAGRWLGPAHVVGVALSIGAARYEIASFDTAVRADSRRGLVARLRREKTTPRNGVGSVRGVATSSAGSEKAEVRKDRDA